MNTDTQTTTARAKLKAHQKGLADLETRSRGLGQQIESARAVIAEAEGPQQRVAELQAERRGLLGELYFGRVKQDAIERIDARLLEAQSMAAAANMKAEAAQIGADMLVQQHEDIALQIGEVSKLTDAMKYAAALEMASGKLATYRAAVEAMGAAHAALMGPALVADDLASATSVPVRPWVRGDALVTVFSPLLPLLPGIELTAWTFDTSAQVIAARQAALAELAG